MAKQLKERKLNVVPGHSLCRQCVKKYDTILGNVSESELENANEVNDDSIDGRDVSDFDPCETPRKRLNTSLETMGISPVNMHGIAQHSRASNAKAKFDKVVGTLKTNISNAYNVVVDTLDDSNSAAENDEVHQKACELDKLYEQLKKKLTIVPYSEKIQILTLAPDTWSRKYCTDYCNVSEYPVRTARELKKVGGILAKPSLKRGGNIAQDTTDLVHYFYEDDEFSRLMPGKKDYVSIKDINSNIVHKQKRLVLCNLCELYAALKKKNPNVKVGFSKFCFLRPKWCVLAGSKRTHSVCVCSMHQNAILLVDAINWDVTYKDLIDKVVCDSSKKECMMRRCESCPGGAGLRDFLDQQLSDVDFDAEFHYNQWDTTDRSTLTTITTAYDDYKEILIETIDKLTRHSYLAKCQAQYLKTT